MLIKRFGESQNDNADKWYQLADGNKIKCDETIIGKLWCKWVVSINVSKYISGNYLVFEFTEPRDLEIQTLEDWTNN